MRRGRLGNVARHIQTCIIPWTPQLYWFKRTIHPKFKIISLFAPPVWLLRYPKVTKTGIQTFSKWSNFTFHRRKQAHRFRTTWWKISPIFLGWAIPLIWPVLYIKQMYSNTFPQKVSSVFCVSEHLRLLATFALYHPERSLFQTPWAERGRQHVLGFTGTLTSQA